jgi:hypothetical protein
MIHTSLDAAGPHKGVELYQPLNPLRPSVSIPPITVACSNTKATSQEPAVPILGTTQHLNAIIAAEASPSKPAEITHFGIFTTDTDATRNIKVSSMQDLNISAMIHNSLYLIKLNSTLLS